MAVAATAEAGECPGTKQWYAGACHYPDEIAELKKQEAAKREERARQRRAADEASCAQARRDDTLEGWNAYLERHREGLCADEAASRIAALSAPPPVEPEPPAAAEPEPPVAEEPEPPPPPPASVPTEQLGEAEEGGVSPLVYVGFSVAGAGLIVGSITGGLSLGKKSDLEEECPDRVCQPQQEDDLDNAKLIGHASTASFVVAGVGAALGVVGLLLPTEEEGEAASLTRPVVGVGYLGLEGRF